MEIQAFFPGSSSLTWQDYTVVLVLLALLIFVGIWFGREEAGPGDMTMITRSSAP